MIDERTKISLSNKHLDGLLLRLFFVLSSSMVQKFDVPAHHKLFIFLKRTVATSREPWYQFDPVFILIQFLIRIVDR